MQNKAIKITVGVIAGILSLSTTAFAGFKVMKNNDDKILSASASPTATPEIIEEIEEVEEVVVVNTNKSLPTTFGTPTSSPKASTSSSSKPSRFDDDDDDEVEFEDEDVDVDEKDDQESEIRN